MDFTLFTKPDYAPSRHHEALCRYLDRFAAGEIKRLMVFMPPQHGKSELVSRRLPAYIHGRNPDARIIACSHNASLASTMNRDVQRIIDDDAYRLLFPGTQLYGKNVRSDRHGSYLRNSDIFEVVGHTGYYKSAGVCGSITGRGFNVGIIDDVFKDRREADSPAIREAVNNWYTSTFRTRRGKDASILLTMTRWHPDDLAGWLLAMAEADPKADQWTVLCFPAVCDSPGPDDPRQPGEALWPARFPLNDLEAQKAANLSDWYALYQQEPRSGSSLEWPDSYFPPFIWFDEWPSGTLLRVLALDPSKGKSDKAGDYSAYVLLGLVRQPDGKLKVYVEADLARRPVNPTRERPDGQSIVGDGLDHHTRFRPQVFAVESNQFQELIGGELQRVAASRGLVLPIKLVEHLIPKRSRIRTLGAFLAEGILRFRANHPGTRLLVSQLRGFPLDRYDDGPDALEMGLSELQKLTLGGPAQERVSGMVG